MVFLNRFLTGFAWPHKVLPISLSIYFSMRIQMELVSKLSEEKNCWHFLENLKNAKNKTRQMFLKPIPSDGESKSSWKVILAKLCGVTKNLPKIDFKKPKLTEKGYGKTPRIIWNISSGPICECHIIVYYKLRLI